MTPIGGEAGKKLEALYAAYFEVQKALAADRTPPAAAAQALHKAASELKGGATLPQSSAKLVQDIAAKSEHLHHLDLAGARKGFKPLSQAVVALATQVRGEGAQTPFTHFYCPMVPGGAGDWLQPGGELLNPYFGSEMLRCGEKVQVYPAKGKPATETNSHNGHKLAPAKEKGA